MPNPANVTNIKLVFDTNVPQVVRDRFINAAGDFNSTANSTARFSQNNTGPTLTIKWMGLWPTATPCSSSSAACTEWPLSGQPGTRIYINSGRIDPNPSNCGWTTSALDYMSRHEMLHALGMMHPNDGLGDLIAGTTKCTGTTSTCPSNPGYPTIMIAKMAFSSSCTITPTLLQTDDKKSLSTLY